MGVAKDRQPLPLRGRPASLQPGGRHVTRPMRAGRADGSHADSAGMLTASCVLGGSVCLGGVGSWAGRHAWGGWVCRPSASPAPPPDGPPSGAGAALGRLTPRAVGLDDASRNTRNAVTAAGAATAGPVILTGENSCAGRTLTIGWPGHEPRAPDGASGAADCAAASRGE